jgi:hypothetical protein
MEQSTVDQIIAATTIQEAEALAKNLTIKTKLMKNDKDLNTRFFFDLAECSTKHPEHVIKFVAFFKQLEGEFNQLKGHNGKINIMLTAIQRQYLRSSRCSDNPKFVTSICAFLGHCYNEELLPLDFPLETIKEFHGLDRPMVAFLNFWLIIEGRFRQVDMKSLSRSKVEEAVNGIKGMRWDRLGEDIFERILARFEEFYEIPVEFCGILAEPTVKIDEKSREFRIIDEIMTNPNYDTDQRVLDTIFLINVYKVVTKLPNEVRTKIYDHIKTIKVNHKSECDENIYDLRDVDGIFNDEPKDDEIDKNPIDPTNKKAINTTNKTATTTTINPNWLPSCNDLMTKAATDGSDVTSSDLAFFDRHMDLSTSGHDPKIKNSILKYIITQILKQTDTQNHATFLAKLAKKDKIFVPQLVAYCVEFLTHSEDFLAFGIVTNVQVFRMVKFTGHLYSRQVMNLHDITTVINDLEDQHLGRFLKVLAFDVCQRFVDDMRNTLVREGPTTKVILSRLDEKIQEKSENSSKNPPKRMKIQTTPSPLITQSNQNLLTAKTSLIKHQRRTTATSNFLDQLHHGFITIDQYDPRKLVAADCLTDLIEAIISRSLESDVIHGHCIDMLDRLFEIYERFFEVLAGGFEKVIERLFNHVVCGGVDWVKVQRVAGMIVMTHREYAEFDTKDRGSVRICLLNRIFEFAVGVDEWKVLGEVFLLFEKDLWRERQSAYLGYLEHCSNTYVDNDVKYGVRCQVMSFWKQVNHVAGERLKQPKVWKIVDKFMRF